MVVVAGVWWLGHSREVKEKGVGGSASQGREEGKERGGRGSRGWCSGGLGLLATAIAGTEREGRLGRSRRGEEKETERKSDGRERKRENDGGGGECFKIGKFANWPLKFNKLQLINFCVWLYIKFVLTMPLNL